MGSNTMPKVVGLFILFGIPFLYVRKVKHSEFNSWEAYARLFIIIYGTGIIISILAGYLMYYAFEGTLEISMAVAKGIAAFLGGCLFFPAIYVANRRVQMAPLWKQER